MSYANQTLLKKYCSNERVIIAFEEFLLDKDNITVENIREFIKLNCTARQGTIGTKFI